MTITDHRDPVEGQGPHQGETEDDHESPDETSEEVTGDVADPA